MSFIDALISKLAPYECLACGYEGAIACSRCVTGVRKVPPRCYRCQRFNRYSLTCKRCRQTSKLKQIYVATVYEGLAKELLWKLKFHGVQAAAKIMAEAMAPMLSSDDAAVLVPVPTASSRARSRGYDQAMLLARALSKQTALPYEAYLGRTGQTHQVGSSRQQRLKQLQAAFWIKPSSTLPRTIILVDDVLTTGATLEAAASTFYRAGLKEIHAVVFAQA